MSEPTTRAIDTNGVRLHALCWGTEGPLAVLVHGFPDTPWTWDVVGPRLAAAGYRVVAPYTRGIGPSTDTSPPNYDTDTLGTDILGLIEALGEDKAVVVGHDFGAAAAYAAAGLGAERVDRLVTLAIPHPAAIRPTPAKLWGCATS
ncbi:MAG: alpha/beta hydrolase [Myxococcales bacterium]|nr:alpha/beta hydrolase [Myxococcales bacterium]